MFLAIKKLPHQPNKMLNLNWKTKPVYSHGHAHANLTRANSGFPTATPKTLCCCLSEVV
jgi:hypothetical protein